MGVGNSALQEQLEKVEKTRAEDSAIAAKDREDLQVKLAQMELEERKLIAENAMKEEDVLRARQAQMELDEKKQAAENAAKERDALRACLDKMELEAKKQAAEKEAGPWREAFNWTESEYDGFMEKITLHQPIGSQAKRAKIILVGQIGSGKSSFINTVFATKGQRETRRAATAEHCHSVTKEFTAYRKSTANDNFSIYDTMGMEHEEVGFNMEDFQNAIAGHLKDGYDFSKGKDKQSDKWRDKPTLEHRMHTVIFMVDWSTIKTLEEPILQKIKTMRQKMNDIGIPIAIILAHCDKAFEHIGQNIRQLYIDRDVKAAVDAAALATGVPAYNIFPMVNDVIGVAHDDIRHLAAYVFSTILTFADDFLENQMKDDDD